MTTPEALDSSADFTGGPASAAARERRRALRTIIGLGTAVTAALGVLRGLAIDDVARGIGFVLAPGALVTGVFALVAVSVLRPSADG